METLGWDSCDIIIVTGDAYVDHPSFGMAIVGRLLEDQGFRVVVLGSKDNSDLLFSSLASAARELFRKPASLPCFLACRNHAYCP